MKESQEWGDLLGESIDRKQEFLVSLQNPIMTTCTVLHMRTMKILFSKLEPLAQGLMKRKDSTNGGAKEYACQ
jgi:hypothetical protein